MGTTPAEAGQDAYITQMLPQGGQNATIPFAQTYDRRLANGTVFAPTSGTMYMTGIYLPAGAKVTGITFVSGSTAESGGTHLWYALYRQGNVQTAAATVATLMAQTADDTGATSFAANTALRKTLATVQTCPYSGLYYLAFMCAQSAGATPTLLNIVAATVNSMGNIAGMTPVLAATADTGLTTTAPASTASLVPVVNCLYAFVD